MVKVAFDTMILAQNTQKSIPLRRSRLAMKLWPNGELSIYPLRKDDGLPQGLSGEVSDSAIATENSSAASGLDDPEGVPDMGLSPVHNFDKKKKPTRRYGLNGITGKGRRTIRNACYLLEEESDPRFLTFATVTVPAIKDDQMALVHLHWAKIVDAYRREIKRALVMEKLPGEVVGVSEIQTKRFAKDGLPVLHGHFVWVGRHRGSDWVIKPAVHDAIWERAIKTALPTLDADFSKSAQVTRVLKSAQKYLSKYMSKGTEVIKAAVDAGFEWWLPRQWWSCSRSLVRRVKSRTKVYKGNLGWFVAAATKEDSDLCAFIHPIEIELLTGVMATVAYVGRLNHHVNVYFRRVLGLTSTEECACGFY